MKGNQIKFINNLETKSKTKRDLTSINNNTVEGRYGRIRKKLIRKKVIYDNKLNSSEHNESSSMQPSKHKRRRKLKIKKKKIKHIISPTTLEDNISETPKSHSRKKLVITRKRLLKSTSVKNNLDSETVTKSQQDQIAITRFHPSITSYLTEKENIADTITSTENQLSDDDSETNTDNPEGVDYDFGTESSESDTEDTTISDPENYDEDYQSSEDYGEDSTEDYYDAESEEEVEETEEEGRKDDENTQDQLQHVPDYEPFFPELSETFEAPIFLLKTTILTSIELQTKTIILSRLRTYKSLITKVSGSEQTVISSTEVKPQIKTTTVIESLTKLTTLTLLDFDSTTPTNEMTISSNTESFHELNDSDGEYPLLYYIFL